GVEDIYKALSNLNLSKNNDNYKKRQLSNKKMQNFKFSEKKTLKIEKLLNIDAANFTNSLDKIIFDTNFESSKEENINYQNSNAKNNVDKKN
ncbi:23228_t:CDS:1, partial [Cetraspora pellucida]